VKYLFAAACAVAALLTGVAVAARPQPEDLASLTGTWVMDSAYEIHPDGTRSTNYGEHPLGLLTVDSAGRYNLQIFKMGRPTFASGDKTRGTADEYRQVVLGSSTHFGTVAIDHAKHQLVFDVKAASFPNWEGKRQLRDYTFRDGVLSYAVPAGASGNGVIAYSVWRRATP
jgi:hypothetical protein